MPGNIYVVDDDASLLVAAVAFEGSHERQEQLRTVALFEQIVAQR